tara:strand:+ start:1321 stop:2142 length:822 start_codon:yes stop_codon:yes gene_type:complete
LIDIFHYTNYRLFLKASYEELKATHKAFSYRYFSQKCGYKSPNFLKMIIDGQRNLSEESIEKFIEFFKLKKKEADYFRLLVQFNQAKTNQTKTDLAQKILKHSAFKRMHPLSRDHFEYYSKWYYVAIRELLATRKIKLDAATISELLTPNVPVKDVEEALESLLRLGLIEKKQNRLAQKQELITTGDEVSSAAIASYHKNMMLLAGDSIDTIDRSLRDISSVTVSLSRENISELKLLIQKFRKEVMELSEQDQNKQTVYQVGIQMFPLSKVED